MPSSEEPRSIAKSLFDSLEVVHLPAVFRPILLVVRDASALHLQLRFAAPVQERHRDRGVMLCGAGRRPLVNVSIRYRCSETSLTGLLGFLSSSFSLLFYGQTNLFTECRRF